MTFPKEKLPDAEFGEALRLAWVQALAKDQYERICNDSVYRDWHAVMGFHYITAWQAHFNSTVET